MNVLQYLNTLRPALPLSKQTAPGEPKQQPSNSEVKRWINEGAVILNGEKWRHDEEMPPIVWKLVLFPKSPKMKCTLV